MDISLRTKQLNSLFSYDKKTELEESHLEIIPFRFTQTRGASEIDEFQKGLTPTGFCPMTDDRIQENKSFSYAIFTPSGRKKNNCLLYTSPSPRDRSVTRMPSSA